ncbi:MAG: transporter [Steroidobacteraceae bacterium]
MKRESVCVIAATLAFSSAAQAASDPEADALRAELELARAAISEQRRQLDAQQARLDVLTSRLGEMRGRGAPAEAASPAIPDQPVGEAPTEPPTQQNVAVLDQSSVVTRKRRLEFDIPVEYARADRNRVIFRGIEVPQSVLVGVFDINESRQDVLTTGLLARWGVTDRLELNARVPLVYRSDSSVLSPVSAAPGSDVGTRDFSVDDFGLGDVELGARYQLRQGGEGRPYWIAGLQVLMPTGSNPFTVPRDTLGNATRSSTGAGFWGVTPSLTALLPSDPAVLFASLGYTINFGRDIDRYIGDTLIERVRPGGEPSFSGGIGLALNPRTSLSFGYAHTWSFGTHTRTRTVDRSTPTPVLGDAVDATSRDLQLGRFMFGVSYRLSDARTLNWNVELGATDDAADVRTSFRLPLGL